MDRQLYETGGEGWVGRVWSGGGGRGSNSTKVSQWVTTGTLPVSSGICALLTVPKLQGGAGGWALGANYAS